MHHTTPQLLLLESSGLTCSAAVSSGNQILAMKSINEMNVHSTYLAVYAQDVMREAKLNFNDLDAVVVSAGPGSYTGLRIGSSLAKGICYASGKPLIAVSSLRAVMESANTTGYCLATVDARRNDAYIALYSDKNEVLEEQFVTFDEDFKERLEGHDIIYVSGDASKKCIEAYPELNLHLVENEMDASSLLPEALIKFQKKQFEDLAYFEPNYIKAVHITPPKKKL